MYYISIQTRVCQRIEGQNKFRIEPRFGYFSLHTPTDRFGSVQSFWAVGSVRISTFNFRRFGWVRSPPVQHPTVRFRSDGTERNRTEPNRTEPNRSVGVCKCTFVSCLLDFSYKRISYFTIRISRSSKEQNSHRVRFGTAHAKSLRFGPVRSGPGTLSDSESPTNHCDPPQNRTGPNRTEP